MILWTLINNSEVKASGSEQITGPLINLDFDFVWQATENISNVIYDATYDNPKIKKGRAWATAGENYTHDDVLIPYLEGSNYCNFSDVDKLQIGYLSQRPEKNYSSKIITKDFRLSISHDTATYPWQTPIPYSEIFPVPSALKNITTGSVTNNCSFTNIKVKKLSEIRDDHGENWPFGGTYNDYHLNLSYENLNENEILIGNVSYIANNESIPTDQEGMVYIIEEVDGCDEKLANITNAIGCILLNNNTRGYQYENATMCDFTVARCNVTSNDNNLTLIKNMLNNSTMMIVDNAVSNTILTFTYNLTQQSCLPNFHYFLLENIRAPSTIQFEDYPQWADWSDCYLVGLVLYHLNIISPSDCFGFILYDHMNTHFMGPSQRDWGTTMPALPMFSVNYSVGNWMVTNMTPLNRPKVSGFLDQEYKQQNESTPGVETYNVVAYRNITKSPDDAIVVISNRIDGWWGQTPGDSGTGCALVLGVAKYFNDYNIKAKYNLTFLFTTGEEYGMRGAQHYVHGHPRQGNTNNFYLWIGADQLAFNQVNTNLSLKCNDTSTHTKIVYAIANQSNYIERTGSNYGLDVGLTGGRSEDKIWKDRCHTICFGKDNTSAWDRYHRAGMNYTEGDSLENIDRNDVNLTFEILWNVTKYFTVNPNCWFTNVSYQNVDSENDGDDLTDSIRVNYSLQSILPHDKAYVEIWRAKRVGTIMVSTLETTVNHIVNRSSRDFSYTCSIPDDDIKGNYTLQLKVYNSTGWIQSVTGIDLWEYNDTSSVSDEYTLYHPFGYIEIGNQSTPIYNNITGSTFTINEYGWADNITAHVYQAVVDPPPKSKCMIYRANDSVLIGTTEEKAFTTTSVGEWKIYNFSEPKPVLYTDTEYVLVCWGEAGSINYTAFDEERGRYNSTTYTTNPPDPINFTNNSRLCSIYCSYTPDEEGPEINNITSTPSPAGLGDTVTITADVTDVMSSVDTVEINIDPPGSGTNGSYQSMNLKSGDTYEYSYNTTWVVGTYNYTIRATDNQSNQNTTSMQNFTVSSNATITVCTVKDDYTSGKEYINLTDPPGFGPDLGYQYLDDGDVLHMWNKYDDYYFNTTSGIQLTNHYNEYWSKNVLMLGYYNNDQWNLIYRTDQLTNFTQEIETDNQTYIDATWWKDLSYSGYPFRLAIRYHLDIDAMDLSVIPYIKNIGQNNIPYILGFGWELKDIQIDMTSLGDYIDVNRTTYYLNQTLDNSYINLSYPITKTNLTTNTSEIIGYTDPIFHLKDDITSTESESLYIRWNKDLTYKLRVKSRQGQTNAPVTLFIRVGTLQSGQQKHTTMYWHDASTVTYYFNSYGLLQTWTNNPSYMVDGSTSNYATTSLGGDVELCTGNTCTGETNLGTITKVEIRAYGKYNGGQRDIRLRPVFGGSTDGQNYVFTPSTTAGWSSWYDITNDESAPETWGWSDINSLDCDVESQSGLGQPFTLYCAKVEIQVTYTSNDAPEISSVTPSNGTTGVTLLPTVSATVSDPNGDTMNITWMSNSSGSWQTFGTNNSVSNGTYYQIFSNATENGQWWWWRINLSDGNDYTLSDIYKFYTGNQSKIVNTGTTNISGYLLIQIQYNNSGTWVVVNDTINETTKRTISAGNTLALDTIFNGQVDAETASSVYGNGNYRIYAALRDPDGVVLEITGGTKIEAIYKFTITLP
jgi:hypothetical protein